MAYIGDKLKPLFDPSEVPFVMRAIATTVGARWVRLAKDNTPRDTGELRESWYQAAVRRRGGVYTVKVVNTADYAYFVEHGTGLYGPEKRKYEIRAKDGGALRFFVGGKEVIVKSVQHPGSPGQHMLAISAAVTEHELERIAEPVIRSWAHTLEARAS